jgi:hypothetical protein
VLTIFAPSSGALRPWQIRPPQVGHYQSEREGIKMKSSATIALAIAAMLSACASPKYNYAPAAFSISEPPLNSVNISQVGDEMLRQGKYKEHEALYVKTETSAGWAYTLYPGYYLKQGEDETSSYYFPGGGDDAGRVEKAALADPWRSVMAKKDRAILCVVTVFNFASCGNESDFEFTKKPLLTKDSFQQTLIYSGKVGSKINIGYREFSGNIARPAFHNDVEYDLSESSVIGYKGAQIEVLEATNQHIKYRVIRNFNGAGL